MGKDQPTGEIKLSVNRIEDNRSEVIGQALARQRAIAHSCTVQGIYTRETDMQEKWLELTDSLEGEIEALTLDQIAYIVGLFESGLSGDFVARLLKGEFAEVAYRIVVNVSLSPFVQQQ